MDKSNFSHRERERERERERVRGKEEGFVWEFCFGVRVLCECLDSEISWTSNYFYFIFYISL